MVCDLNDDLHSVQLAFYSDACKVMGAGHLNAQQFDAGLPNVHYSDVRYSNGGLNTELNLVWYSEFLNSNIICFNFALSHFPPLCKWP